MKTLAYLYILAVLAMPAAGIVLLVAAALEAAGFLGAPLAATVIKAAALCLATAFAVVAGVALGALEGDACR